MAPRSEYNREWYFAHKAERAEYIEQNRDSIKALKARWHKEHPRDRSAERAEYREKNRELLRQKSRDREAQWRIDNPEAVTLRNASSRAKKYGVANDLTLDQWIAILERDGRRCVYCGADSTGMDHVVPLILGGDNVESNVVVSCKPCNQSKGKKTMSEFTASKRS